MSGLSVERASGAVVVLLATLAVGCGEDPTKGPQQSPTIVTVSRPVSGEVTDFMEFTGRLAAPEAVDVQARVTGHLEKIHFKGKEGKTVTKGEPLFDIDPRTYLAELDRVKGQVTLAEARLGLARAEAERARSLFSKNAISREDYDKAVAAEKEADASVTAAKALLEGAQLNVNFCKIAAPITGRISRYTVTEGNLVMADKTVLTTIVATDPIWVNFNADEATVQRVKEQARKGDIKAPSEAAVPVKMALGTDDDYRYSGTVDFVDVRLDPRTGTLPIRAVFPNKDGDLQPGYFARLRCESEKPRTVLMVLERALGSIQGQRYVYVVNDKNEVEQRDVTIGQLVKGRRVIESGLKETDRVIVDGLQRVRPGVAVTPKEQPLAATGK